MPTRSLQFDGPDLESVLAEALAEAGPASRIVAADRVRRGGFAGFFAREHFEVIVEVDDEGAGPLSSARAAACAAPAAVPSPEPRASAPDADTKPGDGDPRPSVTSVPAGRRASHRSFAELADDTEDVVELTSGSAGAASQGVATSVEAAIAGRRTTRPPSGAAVAPARSAGPVEPEPRAPEDGVPSTARPSFASLLAGIARDTAFPAGATVLSGGGPVREGTPATSAVRRRAADAFADAELLGSSDTSGAPLPSAVLERTSCAPAPALSTGVARGSVGRTALALAAAGVPDSLLPAPDVLGCLDTLAATEDGTAYLQLALARSLTSLPAAPPVPAGSGRLVVVAGDLERAWAVARQLADEAGADPAEVRVAAPSRPRRRVERRLLVTGPCDAEELVSERRRSRTVTVVAMDAPVSARPDTWCHDLLDVLVPTAVWGVVPATHKSADVAAWADALGGLDALAVVDAASSTSPGSLLELGIPVASLDGRAANPALWAAVLVGQLLLTRGARPAPAEVGG